MPTVQVDILLQQISGTMTSATRAFEEQQIAVKEQLRRRLTGYVCGIALTDLLTPQFYSISTFSMVAEVYGAPCTEAIAGTDLPVCFSFDPPAPEYIPPDPPRRYIPFVRLPPPKPPGLPLCIDMAPEGDGRVTIGSITASVCEGRRSGPWKLSS